MVLQLLSYAWPPRPVRQLYSSGLVRTSYDTQPTRVLEALVQRPRLVAVKLKYHRLKPGGVRCASAVFPSCEIKVPPAEAWWCPINVGCVC